MVFGAAAVSMNHVQNAVMRPAKHAVLAEREFAQRSQRVRGDVVVDELEVTRMAREQYLHVALGQIRALLAEGTTAEMQDERIVT